MESKLNNTNTYFDGVSYINKIFLHKSQPADKEGGETIGNKETQNCANTGTVSAGEGAEDCGNIRNPFLVANITHGNYGFDRVNTVPLQKKKRLRFKALVVTVVAILCMAAVAKSVGKIEDSHSYENNNNNNNYNNNYSYSVDYSDGESPRIRSDDEIEETLRSLSEIDERYAEIYDNIDRYPHDLLQALCNNPEMLDFTLGYLSRDGEDDAELTEEEIGEDSPLFIQWDKRWGYEPYGDDIIALSGCGPTCLSMVSVSMTGNTAATPKAVADFAMSSGYYEVGSGTMWSLMTEGCYYFGLQSEEIPLNKGRLFDELNDGKMIICSMNPGDFTAMGHFIVLCGIEDGKIRVHDPNSRSRSEKLWTYEELDWQIRNLWVFST